MRLAFLFSLIAVIFAQSTPKLLYEWVTVDYEWISEQQKEEYIQTKQFIVENNAITGVKSYNGDLYVTVPRWRPGVPSTLNKVIMSNGKPILQPFPSWDMQQIGNYSALQNIQSMEIDSRGWMWILDVGRLNILSKDPSDYVNGPPKLFIWDIENNCMINQFVFPDEVLPYNNSFANDIVVDETNGFAYISDTWAEGGIIIYNLNNNQARRFDDPPTQMANTSQVVTINGVEYSFPSPTDGIALSHDTQLLYYCSISRATLFTVPTYLLQDFSIPSTIISGSVVDLGEKGFSDGMACDNQGNLYYGDYVNSAVKVWNLTEPLSLAKVLVQNTQTMQWADTFAFDNQGSIIFSSNKLELFLTNTMKFDGSDGSNFRVWSVNIGADSYLTNKPIPPNRPCEINS